MNQYERVKSILDKITYRPGWVISVSKLRDPHIPPDLYYADTCYPEEVYVSVRFQADDVYQQGKKIWLQNQRYFYADSLRSMSDADIIRYCIFYLILETEKHESEEWFKVDGVQVFDPHPETKKELVSGK